MRGRGAFFLGWAREACHACQRGQVSVVWQRWVQRPGRRRPLIRFSGSLTRPRESSRAHVRDRVPRSPRLAPCTPPRCHPEPAGEGSRSPVPDTRPVTAHHPHHLSSRPTWRDLGCGPAGTSAIPQDPNGFNSDCGWEARARSPPPAARGMREQATSGRQEGRDPSPAGSG